MAVLLQPVVDFPLPSTQSASLRRALPGDSHGLAAGVWLCDWGYGRRRPYSY